jgi:hypothetical protein
MTCNRLVVFSGYSVAICDKVCQWLVTGWWFSLGAPWQYVIKFVNLLQVIDKLYHILPRSTQRKPPTCHKSLTNIITYCHGVPRENHQPVTSHWQTLSHIAMKGVQTTLLVIGTDYTGSCKSYYHTIITAPIMFI